MFHAAISYLFIEKHTFQALFHLKLCYKECHYRFCYGVSEWSKYCVFIKILCFCVFDPPLYLQHIFVLIKIFNTLCIIEGFRA